MSRKRNKPSDPAKRTAQIEAAMADARAIEATPARWGEQPAPISMREAFERQGVEFDLDHKGRLKRAKRVDFWEDLHQKRALADHQLAAVRRLERLIHERTHGPERPFDLGDVVVQRQGDAAGVTDAMIEAGRLVDRILRFVGPPSSRLLAALIEPGVYGEPIVWRDVVARETRETNDRAQMAAVRFAAQALADVFDEQDRSPRAFLAEAERARDLVRAGV